MRAAALLILLATGCREASSLGPAVDAHCRAEAEAVRRLDPAELVATKKPTDGAERAVRFCHATRRPSARADALFDEAYRAAQDFDESFKHDPPRALAARERLAAALESLGALPRTD